MEFRAPWWLLSTILALVIYVARRRAREKSRIRFSSFAALPKHGDTWRTRLAFLPDLLLCTGALALAIALAGPRIGDRGAKVSRQGIAIMMVMDTSGSMRALDLSEENRERTRLDAVKDVFRDFVLGGKQMGTPLKGRDSDLVGIVTFARYADTRSPLTLDHGSLETVLRTIELVTDRREDGTAMGDGLALAVERLRESSAPSKVAILLTDGVQNAGETEPLAAAELARASGVKVYAVGAGTNGLAPVRVQDPFTGRPTLTGVPVEIDEESLQQIAQKTGGRYFRATDADALRHIYQEIDRLERTKLEEERYLSYREYYPHATVIGLALVMLSSLLGLTVLRRLP